ncbi:restriction endonuclease [Burkholderia anthina]|uniref:restriction endonuclease n=1 Tax=Burkholderia anthina TaxID=179879 RepID=UPI00158ADA99|nr:restriction endonuclease [Burkholderia anthina]
MDTFLSVLGIAVSFVLFLIGYRQTIGAKKERIAACNVEVEKILLRRLILEGYAPNRLDIERLADGKARDFRVSADDLLSVQQILNTLYTRIVESDLVPADERRSMVERITPALVESEAKLVEGGVVESSEASGERSTRMRAVALMAVLASLVGALVAALPNISKLGTVQPDFNLVLTAVITIAASLAVISLFLTAYKLRAAQEEPTTKSDEMAQYVRFERDVASVLKKAGASTRAVSSGLRAGDFIAERGGRKYLIEVKSWSRRVPSRMLAELADRLRLAAATVGADETIVVTKVPQVDTSELPQIPGVIFLTEKQLATYLRRSNGQSDAA